jgi:hypothetical protein
MENQQVKYRLGSRYLPLQIREREREREREIHLISSIEEPNINFFRMLLCFNFFYIELCVL